MQKGPLVCFVTFFWTTWATQGFLAQQPWTADDLQQAIDWAVAEGSHRKAVRVPAGDYYFYWRSLNVTHAQNLSIIPLGNITLWFSGEAGINVSHSIDVQIGHDVRSIIVDYDPPPPQHTNFHETSGITLHLYNCTRVAIQNVIIHAAPFMAVTAFQGGGDHLFRQLIFEPSPNRTLVGVRDALHFSDLRKGPTVVDSTIGYTGDDFFNVHSTLLLVLQCKMLAREQDEMECLIVNPRVSVDAQRETVYGTLSTLKFVEAHRDVLSFYQWPSIDMIVTPLIQGAVVQSINDVTHSYGQIAQQTLPPLLMFPPTMSWVEATNQTTKFSANEVGSANATLSNNTFVRTNCNFGRFKSIGGTLQGNVFRQARIQNLELSALPQWFEGPIDVRDIFIADNQIEGENPIHCGPLCEKPECHPGECDTCPFCDGGDTFWAKNITLRNNIFQPQYATILLED